MTIFGASPGSTAKFGASDNAEIAMALPTAEETGHGDTDVGPPALSYEELGEAVLVPSLILKKV